MFPTLGPLPTHDVFVGLGVLAAVVVFVAEARRRDQTDERIAYVVLGALVGGAVFMSAAEIVEQVVAGARSLARGEVPGGPGRVNNVVFMAKAQRF